MDDYTGDIIESTANRNMVKTHSPKLFTAGSQIAICSSNAITFMMFLLSILQYK